MNFQRFVISGFLLLCGNVHAQQLTPAGTAALDSYLQEAIATTHIPGMVALVVNKDGIGSTARDYARFIRLFLNGGSVEDSGQLLSAETIAEMGRNHIGTVRVGLMQSTNRLLSENFPEGAGVDTFGLGFQRTEAALPDMRSPGSLAWAGIFNTEFWIDRQAEIGAVLMMQFLPFYDAAAIEVLQGFERRIYQNLEE